MIGRGNKRRANRVSKRIMRSQKVTLLCKRNIRETRDNITQDSRIMRDTRKSNYTTDTKMTRQTRDTAQTRETSNGKGTKGEKYDLHMTMAILAMFCSQKKVGEPA